MRFRLHDIPPVVPAILLRGAGRDAVTELDQGLMGARDSDPAPVCMRESRTSITFDTDFADIPASPPGAYAGLVVFRPGSRERGRVPDIGRSSLNMRSGARVSGPLRTVEESRIRIRH